MKSIKLPLLVLLFTLSSYNISWSKEKSIEPPTAFTADGYRSKENVQNRKDYPYGKGHQPIRIIFKNSFEKPDTNCQPNLPKDNKFHKPIYIKAAKDLELCKDVHFSIESKNVVVALKSFKTQFKEIKETQTQFGADSESHSFELHALFSAYSYLLSKSELRKVKKISKSKSPLNDIAKDLLLYRKSGKI